MKILTIYTVAFTVRVEVTPERADSVLEQIDAGRMAFVPGPEGVMYLVNGALVAAVTITEPDE